MSKIMVVIARMAVSVGNLVLVPQHVLTLSLMNPLSPSIYAE